MKTGIFTAVTTTRIIISWEEGGMCYAEAFDSFAQARRFARENNIKAYLNDED